MVLMNAKFPTTLGVPVVIHWKVVCVNREAERGALSSGKIAREPETPRSAQDIRHKRHLASTAFCDSHAPWPLCACEQVKAASEATFVPIGPGQAVGLE
jgi:hypothetical protein